MNTRYAVRTVLLVSGERLPLLVLEASGEPLFDAAVYTVSILRAENKASNTIEATLRALSILYMFLELRHIDLEERLRTGWVLSLDELDELVRLCRLPLSKMYAWFTENQAVAAPSVISLEAYRMKQRVPELVGDVTSAATRVRYIRDYLFWLVNTRLSRHGNNPESRATLVAAAKQTKEAFNARIPSDRGRNVIGGREGLGEEAIDRLLSVIDPENPANPWFGKFARKRNQLAIHWLYGLGLRRGELLGVEIKDINFANGTVEIRRKADSPSDRILPLTESLLRMTRDYITDVRSGKKGGLPHGFLFVAAGSGRPLSLIALNKTFEVLRKKFPDLPRDLTPHVLRHSTNDAFSKKMDELGIGEADEKELRSQLMGWKPTSNTASTYIKRHVREKTSEVSLAMQSDIVNRANNNGPK
jgi:integrase